MKKVLFLLLATVLSLTQMMAQQDSVSIGSATTSSSTSAIPGLWGNHRSVHLYSASEMNLPEGGMIESLALDIASVTSGSGRELRIYMKEVNDTTLPQNMTINALDDDAVLVYNSNGPLEITPNQWNYITLQSPFLYSGEGSLYIYFEGEGCGPSGGCSVNVKGANGASKAWTKAWDTTTPDLNAPIARSNDYRANIRLFYSPITDDYCYPVQGVTISDILIDEATISWTSDNNSFEIQCKLQSETWDSENVITETSSSTSITLSGLLPSSYYDVRIKSICSVNESLWMGTSFTTGCDVISTFPWVETFDNAWDYNPMTDTAFHPAPLCWLNMSAKAANSSYIAKQSSGDAYINGYTSSTSTNEAYRNSEWLMTPVLELSGNETLSFFTKKSSSSYSPELRIYAFELSDGDVTSLADTSAFFLLDSITTFATTYEEKEISLEDLSGQYRLAFVRNRKIGQGAVYVNDVTVMPTPACSRPSGLTASNITGNSVDLTWTESDEATSYNIYYKTSNASTWNIVEATENPFTLTGLEQATAYDINIKAICSDGNETGFALDGIVDITTSCMALVPPVLETFDTYPAGTAATNCWKEAKGLLSNMMQPDSSVTIASNNWGSYSSYVFDDHAAIELYSSTRTDWLISPPIDLGDGSISYDLKFDLAFTYWSSAAPAHTVQNQKFAVLISTDGGLTWDYENAIIWDSTSADQENPLISSIPAQGQRVVVDLSEYQGTIMVGFYGEQVTSGGDNRIHIDNFQVVEHVDCLDLLSFDLAVATPTSVAISWPVPEDSDYDAVIIYNEGDTIDWENGITENVTAGTEFPYILEGLSSGTTYTFSVAFDCGGQYAQPITITMPSGGAEIPFICDFDDPDVASLWTINNGTHATKLYIGALSTEPDNNKLYVSSDNGATLSYSNSGTNVVTAAVPLQFPEEGVTYKIKFDYKGGGETSWDYIKVLLLDLDEDISATTASTQPAWAASTYAQEGFLYLSGVKFNLQNNVTTAEIIVPGELVNGTLKNLVFAWRQDSGGGDGIGVEIDNVSVVETACSAPTGFALVEDGAQTNSLTFDLETESGEEWEIQYMVYGAETWESYIASSSTGIEISDLMSGTMYKFRVRSICGEDTSWFAPVNDNGYVLYQTLCEDITISEEEPFVETFDAPTWFRSGSITTDNDFAPSCWFNIDAKHATYNWRHVTTAANSYNESAGSLAMYSSTSVTSDTISDWFITPIFSLNGTETLSFFAKAGTANETLKIMYYNVDEYEDMVSRDDTVNFELLSTIEIPANEDYVPYDISLSELSGRYRLAFYASVPGNYLRIDEVSVHIVDCQRPETDGIYVSDITPTSATINIEDELNTAWSIFYKTESETVYTEYPTTSTSTEFVDLLPNTTYEFYVVGDCGGTQSAPTTVISFATSCNYVTELPFVEDFEGAWAESGLSNATAPDCWININGGYSSTTYVWKQYTTATNVYAGLASAQSYGYTSATTSTYVNNDFLITPVIDVEGGARLSFWAKKGTTSYNGKIKIKYYDVTENGDIASASDTANFIDLVEISNFTTTYEKYTFDLPELPSTYRIALARQDTSNGYVYIDDLSIDYAPSCIRPEPNSVVVSDVNTNTAVISWTDNDESHSSWNVYYRVAGTEEYSFVAATEPSVELTDLISATSYEVYVTTNCGNEESEGTYAISFTTLQEPVEIPYSTTFDDVESGEWLLKNGNLTNKWYIGVPTGAEGGELYISNDNGVNASYTVSSASSIVIAEKLFQLGASDSIRISFDLTVGGEGSADYLKVFWLSADTVFDATNSTAYYPAAYGYASGVLKINPNDPTDNYVNLLSGTQHLSITIPNSQNQLRKIVFLWKNDSSIGTQPGAIIDNFEIEEVGETLTCFRPVDNSLTATNITTNSATISWEASDESQTAWTVYYKMTGEETYTSVQATETMIELTDLNPSTSYQVYVTTNCGNEESYPSTMITFYTACGVVTAPWGDNFETNVLASGCWNEATGLLTSNVTFTSTTSAYWNYNTTSAINGVTSGLYKVNIYGTSRKEWIITPQIDLGDGSELYQVSLDVALTDYNNPANIPDPAADDKFAIVVSTDGGTTWSSANALIWADGDSDTEHNYSDFTNTFTRVSYVLQDAEGNPYTGIVKIGIYGESTASNGDNDLFIDNLSIELAEGGQGGTDPEPEPCDAPTELAASNVTQTTADITWTGTATSYEFKLNGETAEVLTATTKSLTGLTANTQYTVEVRSVCDDQTSDWVTITFTTLQESGGEIIAPVVTTLAATAITHESATLNGTITAGSEEITAQGFMYKATAATDWTTVNATGTTISATLSALTAETEYTFKAFATTATGTVEGESMTFTTTTAPIVVTPPTVATLAATAITHESAVLNGTITAGSETITAQGFMYKASTAADWTTVNATGTTMTATVANLTAETAYTFKAFATTASGTVEGTAMTFTTTAAPIVAPVVTTLAATAVDHESATLNGTITAGSETITAQGFMYKATAAADWTTVNATGTTISATLSALTAETEYTFKAFATTASGTVEGTAMTFTTTAAPIVAPVVTTLAATAVDHESATLNGTITAGSETITAQGFMYKATAAADWTTVNATGETITATLTALTAETEYTFKAFATTASGTVEGTAMTFTTSATPIVAPTVVTLAATEITNATAKLNGTITAGSEDIIAQGFMYKASNATDWATVAAVGETMSLTVEGLEAELEYVFKAFATTASGTTEGEELTFTTLAGLNDATAVSIIASVYPNPAEDKATISVSGLMNATKIVVSDMQGRILLSDDMTESTYELNTSNYASGVYYIRIISGNAVNTQKLIVK